jgi:ribosomal protein S18 acetylase RimI-like enzyme
MQVRKVVTYLEMTSPDQLRPGHPAAMAVDLQEQDKTSPLIRATHERIAAPYHWSSLYWTDEEWEQYLARPHLRHWIAWADGAAAGLISIESQSGGDAEIDTFGLVPEFVGKGIGGHFLTLGTRLAWSMDPVGAPCIKRVWLSTSSLDHPYALPNYKRRGFRVFRTEGKLREIPG